MSIAPAIPALPSRPLVRAGLVLGAGFGGFADGIVLHQILGWHHLVCVSAFCQSATVAQLQLQNTQDGFFHLGLWLVTLTGLVMLFRAARTADTDWSGRTLTGAMLAGAGLFNIVEGLINHQLLGIHHVLPGDPHELAIDLVYLVIGLVVALAGFRIIRTPRGA